MDQFDLLKSEIKAYTKKSGAFVGAHSDKRPKAKLQALGGGKHGWFVGHGFDPHPRDKTFGPGKMEDAKAYADEWNSDSVQKPGTTGLAFDGPAQKPASDDASEDANLDHPAYNTPVKMKGYNAKGGVTAHQAVSSRDAANVIIKNKPDWSKEDHTALAEKHRAAADKHHEDWSKTADEAAQKTWGRKFGFGDYKVSGIGSDEFSDEHKEALRNHAHSAGKHSTLAAAHAAAAKSRLTK